MLAWKWQSARASWQQAGCTALLLMFFLSGCAALDLPNEQTPPAGNASYDKLIAEKLNNLFSERENYDTFEISGLRWVHALPGWSWLACIRFRDQGHPRTYAVFIKNDAVVDARYAVQTDACGSQAYSPFDAAMGVARPAAVGIQQPIY